jgi:ketosteroid isomerase-like protein
VIRASAVVAATLLLGACSEGSDAKDLEQAVTDWYEAVADQDAGAVLRGVHDPVP